MAGTILLWVFAMICAVYWQRAYTLCFIGAMLFVGILTQALSLSTFQGWLLLVVMVVTPWLLDAQRRSAAAELKRLHAQEASQMTHLSNSARSLMSLQGSAQQIEAQIAQITDLYHVTKETVRALHVRELFRALVEVTPRMLSVRGLRLIDCFSEKPQCFRAAATLQKRLAVHLEPEEKKETQQSTGTADSGVLSQLAPLENAILQEASTAGRLTQTPSGLPLKWSDGTQEAFWVPLRREQQLIGVLIAEGLAETQLPTLSIMANQISLQLSRVHLYHEVERLAITDALTGVFVRHHFLQNAREELLRSKRHSLACTLLMVDLDRFKQKNDTYGHLVGDVVLKETARLLQDNLRAIDMIARYGGEEFILMLVETHYEQALFIAQRLRQLIEVHPIRAYDEVLNQTISIGVATFPDHGNGLEALIERADQALYAAKHAGRNRVVGVSEIPRAPNPQRESKANTHKGRIA